MATGGVGIAVGRASIPSVESGTISFGTGVPASEFMQLQFFYLCEVQSACLVQKQRVLVGKSWTLARSKPPKAGNH